MSKSQLTWHCRSWRLRTAAPQAGAVVVVRYVASLLRRARLLPAVRLVLAGRRTTGPGPRLVRRHVVRGLPRPHPLRCPAVQSPTDASRVTSHHHVSANHSPASKPSSVLINPSIVNTKPSETQVDSPHNVFNRHTLGEFYN